MISFRCAVAVVAGLQLLPHQIKGPILHIPCNMFAISHVLSFQITESDGESKKRKEFPEFIQKQLRNKTEAPEAKSKQIEALPEAHPEHILVGENVITF